MNEFTVSVGRFGEPDYHVWTCSRVVEMGRAPGCDIQLYHPMVSRRHALLSLDGSGRFHLRDLNSKNGTIVNGQLVQGGEIAQAGALSILVGPFALTALRRGLPDDETVPAGLLAATRRIVLDRGLRQVRRDGRALSTVLGDLEYRLVNVLDAAAPNVVPRDTLADEIWGEGQWDVYMLHNLIRRVRKKLQEGTGEEQEFIVTVPGHGYRLG